MHRVQVGGEAVPVPPPRFVVHSAPVRVVPVPSAEPPPLVDVREAEGIPCFDFFFVISEQSFLLSRNCFSFLFGWLFFVDIGVK